jgi:uncharacterized protein (DUF1330 family)
MAAYLIARVRVDDPEKYKQYAVLTPAIVAKFGGRILARGGAMEVLEGATTRKRVVLLEFDSMETARNFYHSSEYQQARRLRLGVSDGQFLIVEGAP